MGFARYSRSFSGPSRRTNESGSSPSGKHHHADVEISLEQIVRPARRRGKPRLVAIKKQENVTGKTVDGAPLFDGERGARCGDDIFDSGLMQGDDIEVALYNNGGAGSLEFGACLIDSIEDLAFMVDRGIGGVFIFCAFAFQYPRAESENAGGLVDDGKNSPAAECMEGAPPY